MPISENQHTSTESLLQLIRDDYLQALPARLQIMEQLVLKLSSNDNFLENFHEVYRHVHSIKGSAGTHGLHILSRISHRLEDYLTTVVEKHGCLDKLHTNYLLQFIDLLVSAHCSLIEANENISDIEARLETLDVHLYKDISKVLIVEQSKSTIQILSKILSHYPVQIVTAREGMPSLERLMHDKFDLLFIGMELPLLNGLALIAALRLAHSKNSHMPIVLLTSNTEVQLDGTMSADYVIQRDKYLGESVTKAVAKVFSQT